MYVPNERLGTLLLLFFRIRSSDQRILRKYLYFNVHSAMKS